MGTEHSAGELPPRPDAESGEPVPPEAPTVTAEGFNEKKRSRVPKPPPGRGPVLAHYRQRRYLSWLGGFIPVTVLAIAFLLHSGLEAVKIWPLWILLGVVYAWSVFVSRANVVSAGSDWVMCRKYWVDTYGLAKIDCRSQGLNQPVLVLEDAERSLEMPISLAEADRTLWNYVFLGMRHSAAGGAAVTLRARATYPQLGEHAVGRERG